MRPLRTAALAVYDFIVGDDWRLAVAVVAALALTGLFATLRLPAWPVTPAVAIAVIVWSTVRMRAR